MPPPPARQWPAGTLTAPSQWPAGTLTAPDCSLLAHPGGVAGRKPGHEQSGRPGVHVDHAVAARLGDTKRPVKEGFLWRERGPRSPSRQDRNLRHKERGGESDRAPSSPHPREETQSPQLLKSDPSLTPPCTSALCPPLQPTAISFLLAGCLDPASCPCPRPTRHPCLPATPLRSQTGQVKTRVPKSITDLATPYLHPPVPPHLSATPTACRQARFHLDLRRPGRASAQKQIPPFRTSSFLLPPPGQLMTSVFSIKHGAKISL